MHLQGHLDHREFHEQTVFCWIPLVNYSSSSSSWKEREPRNFRLVSRFTKTKPSMKVSSLTCQAGNFECSKAGYSHMCFMRPTCVSQAQDAM
uniref:Uncharacterized protein n=1 Tax=Noccaea caerulescens TaxID=107243 RepID=A0A1J3DYT7_NOCCA